MPAPGLICSLNITVKRPANAPTQSATNAPSVQNAPSSRANIADARSQAHSSSPLRSSSLVDIKIANLLRISLLAHPPLQLHARRHRPILHRPLHRNDIDPFDALEVRQPHIHLVHNLLVRLDHPRGLSPSHMVPRRPPPPP